MQSLSWVVGVTNSFRYRIQACSSIKAIVVTYPPVVSNKFERGQNATLKIKVGARICLRPLGRRPEPMQPVDRMLFKFPKTQF